MDVVTVVVFLLLLPEVVWIWEIVLYVVWRQYILLRNQKLDCHTSVAILHTTVEGLLCKTAGESSAFYSGLHCSLWWSSCCLSFKAVVMHWPCYYLDWGSIAARRQPLSGNSFFADFSGISRIWCTRVLCTKHAQKFTATPILGCALLWRMLALNKSWTSFTADGHQDVLTSGYW